MTRQQKMKWLEKTKVRNYAYFFDALITLTSKVQKREQDLIDSDRIFVLDRPGKELHFNFI